MQTNIALNDEVTEIIELESNMGGGVNVVHCTEQPRLKTYEFSIDKDSIQNVIDALQEHIDNA